MRYLLLLFAVLNFSCSMLSFAKSLPQTHRFQQIANKKVTVWEAIIYPNENQKLAMHRHDNDRVLVALTDGVLKITSDKGNTHLLKLTKDHSYFLSSDIPGELHTDENIGKTPIKVIVIGLN